MEDLLDRPSDRLVTVQVPGNLQRSAKGECFVLPPDHTGNLPRRVSSLVQAVARANDWAAGMVSGQFANSRAIAKETGLDERYVSRILPLAFLAPDLTEAILEGTQGRDVSLADYLKELPLQWDMQRRSFCPLGSDT